MRWILYNVFFAIGYALMTPHFLLRMKKRGGYRAHFGERFGRYDEETARRLAEKPRVWIHAVSVGEANIAKQFVVAMRRLDPSFSCVLSTTSSTGRAEIDKIVGADDIAIYFPLDFPPCVRRCLDTVNAKALLITETEFWPNILRAARRRGLPLMLLNGRVSDHSAPKYRKLKFFFGPALSCFDKLLAQSDLDRDRLVAAGAPADRILVTGSVKFDITPPPAEKIEKAKETLAFADIVPGRDTILLGGSTWPGEELAMLEAWRAARAKHPSIRLAICPRHFEKGAEIAQALEKAGASVIRRSQCKPGESRPAAPAAEPPVLLVDTTGELFALYSQADLVFVGKTLDPHIGGQNMIEPASFGKAVLCGPHTENFKPVMSIFRKAGAIREVADAGELLRAVVELLDDADARRRMGENADRTVNASRGALAQSVEAIRGLLAARD